MEQQIIELINTHQFKGLDLEQKKIELVNYIQNCKFNEMCNDELFCDDIGEYRSFRYLTFTFCPKCGKILPF